MNMETLVDDQLVELARQAGQHATAEEAVRSALEEYVSRRRRQRIIDLFGTVEYEDDYDYKALRHEDRPCTCWSIPASGRSLYAVGALVCRPTNGRLLSN